MFLLGLVSLGGLFLVQCGGSDVGPERQLMAQETSQVGSSTDLSPVTKADSIGGTTVAVDAGFASDGSSIAIPTGFTVTQCKFTAAAANIDGSALSTTVSINSTTGQVVCKKVVQEREEVPATSKSCAASYTVICVK